MIIKKYVADSLDEAHTLVQEELGPEALILTSRQVKEKGIKALFGNVRVEVTAAIDEKDLRNFAAQKKEGKVTPKKAPTKDEEKKVVSTSTPKRRDPLSGMSAAKAYQQAPVSSVGTAAQSQVRHPGSLLTTEETVQISPMARRMEEKKRLDTQSTNQAREEEKPAKSKGESAENLKDLMAVSSRLLRDFQQGKIPDEGEASAPKARTPTFSAPNPEKRVSNDDVERLREMVRQEVLKARQSVSQGLPLEAKFGVEAYSESEEVRFLISKGVARSIAVEIHEALNAEFGEVKEASRTARLNGMKRELASRIRTAGPILLNRGEPNIVVFVGPTGVGKSTTIGKIAAQYRNQGKRVAIITTDASKAGGDAQLRRLAQRIEVPMRSAESPSALSGVLAGFSNADLILIDTGGRSQYCLGQIDQLSRFLQCVPGALVLLTMSVATRDLDIYGTIQEFSRLQVDSLVFTKLDESIAKGVLVNVAERTGKPLRYLTKGQNLLSDLEIAESHAIAKALLVEHNEQHYRVLREMASQ